MTGREKSIGATFFSGASDWISLLEGSIRDVDLSDFDHAFSLIDIAAGLVKTSEYLYPLIDYGTWENTSGLTGDRVELFDLKPAVFVRDLLKYMFREIHWNIDGEVMDDFWFQRLIIPFSSAEFNHAGSWAADRSLEMVKGAAQSQTGGVEPVTFTGTVHEPTEWNGTDTYTAGDNINVNIKCSCIFTAAAGNPDLQIFIDAAVVATTSVTGAGEFIVEIDDQAVPSGSTIKIQMDDNAGTWTIEAFTARLTIEVQPEILLGNSFEFISMLPDISKKDLLRYIFIHRGIIPSSDNFSKTLTLSFFKSVNQDTQDDWTEKIDGLKRVDYTELFESYGQNTWFRYQSSEDEKLKSYEISNNKNYGDGKITIANEFLEKDVDFYDAPFSGTVNYRSLKGRANLPFIQFSSNGTDFTELQDPGFRILYCLPNIDIEYFVQDGSIFFGTTVGEKTMGAYAFFVKPKLRLPGGPTDLDGIDEGLAFDTPNDDAVYSVGMIERYMGDMSNILQNGKTETFMVRLTEVDVREYDISKPVFIIQVGGGKLYYKNRLRNFEDSKASQEVELIPFE